MENFRYNWFETNIAQFLFKYDLPISNDKESILDFIETYRDSFLEDFDKILLKGNIPGAPNELYSRLEQQKSFISDAFNKISNIFKDIENSQYALAEEGINQLLKNVMEDFLVTPINNIFIYNPKLYRVRVSNKNTLHNKMELFHVPYHLRYKSSNERYSVSGKPNLYLSTSLNLAWRECGSPSEFYYANFKYHYINDIDWRNKDWKFLSFLRPRDVANMELCSHISNAPKEVADFLVKYLRTFPLIFSCSIIKQYESAVYSPEYLIPQLLSQWVERNHEQIRGILYFPCARDNSLRQYNGYNIAMPAYNYNSTGYSVDLVEKFDIESIAFSSNTISHKDKETILELYNDIVDYQPILHPISDAHLSMFKILSWLKIIASNSEKLPSDVLIGFIESVLYNFRNFKRYFPIESIMTTARQEPEYQSRYEDSIDKFKILYNKFIKLEESIDHYYLYLERGFDWDEKINLE